MASSSRLGCKGDKRALAYLAIWGAISLQGPHHVANQSTTTTGFAAMVSLKPAALDGTRKHTVSIMEPASEVGAAAAGRRSALRRARRQLAFARMGHCGGAASARTTHVSMLWTVILGSVEWNDLAKVIRADVDRGVLEVEVRVAMFRSGRRNCFAGICIAGRTDGGWSCREKLPVAPFLYWTVT